MSDTYLIRFDNTSHKTLRAAQTHAEELLATTEEVCSIAIHVKDKYGAVRLKKICTR